MRFPSLALLLCLNPNLWAAEEPTVDRTLIEQVVQKLAADNMAGRLAGSRKTKAASRYLAEQMAEHNFKPLGDKGKFLQKAGRGVNVVGVMYPMGKEDAAPAIIVGAHYDGLGKSCQVLPGSDSSVCNGAADNAAGVAAAFAAVDAVAQLVEEPIVLALWDGEEKTRGADYFGSTAFFEKPGFDTSQLKLLINLDIVGLDLFPGMENHSFALATETGGDALRQDVSTVSLDQELTFLSYAFGHDRGDVTALVKANYELPFVFFTDGDGGVYHSSADDVRHLNMDKVVRVAKMVASLTLLAAKTDKQYTYKKPVILQKEAPPLFEDIKETRKFLAKIVEKSEGKLDQMTMNRLKDMDYYLGNMLEAGPEYFEQPSMNLLGQVVRGITKISREVAGKNVQSSR